jgi:hypothetical protein
MFGIAFLAMVVGTIGAAGNIWHLATRAADGTSVFIREPTGSNSERLVWVKLDYSTKTLTAEDRRKREVEKQLAERGLLACGGRISPFCSPGQDEPRETIQQWAVRCKERTMSIRSTTVYDARGQVIQSGSGPTKFTQIVPDTIAEGVADKVCKAGERG